jgi:hypothetical protein
VFVRACNSYERRVTTNVLLLPLLLQPLLLRACVLRVCVLVHVSFNSLGKVQQECFDLWARVLQNVPDSRICLKSNVAFSMPYISNLWYAPIDTRVHINSHMCTLSSRICAVVHLLYDCTFMASR